MENEGGVVLLIEDEAKIAHLIQRVLEGCGYRTQWCGTGVEGLAAAVFLIPEVIVLDLSLPDIEGNEVLRTLRARPETHDIPVIITSALPDRLTASDRELTQAILAKPFRFEQLLYAITTVAPLAHTKRHEA
jgi:CheY-like chemotaxis protein